MAEKWRAKWSERQEPWLDDFLVIDDRLAGPDPDAPTNSLAFWRAADWLMLPLDALPIGVVARDDILLLYLSGPRRGEVHLRCDEYLDAAQETTPQDVEAAIHFVASSFGEFYRALAATDQSDS